MSHIHLAVLGAGPVGIEMAVAAVRAGMRVTLIEREDQIAGNIVGPGGWGHVLLFSANKLNCSSTGLSVLRECGAVLPDLDAFPSGQEYVAQYLQPLGSFLRASEYCTVRCGTEVISVGRGSLSKGQCIGSSAERLRAKFRVLVSIKSSGGKEEMLEDVDAVVDATGTYGNHNWVGKGGVPALGERGAAIRYTIPNHSNGSTEQQNQIIYCSKNGTGPPTVTAVIGSGASAITAIKSLQLLGLRENSDKKSGTAGGGVAVVWITRRSNQPYARVAGDPLRQRDSLYEFGNLMAAAGAKAAPSASDGFASFRHVGGVDVLSVHRVCDPEEARGDGTKGIGIELTLQHRVGGRQEKVWAHNVLGLVGYRPDMRITEELQVHYCYATQGPMKLAAAMMAASGGGGGDCLKQVAPGAGNLKSPEPGLFVLGMKAYGRGSGFLLRIGHEQVQQVLELLNE